jgi:hypothetical protein
MTRTTVLLLPVQRDYSQCRPRQYGVTVHQRCPSRHAHASRRLRGGKRQRRAGLASQLQGRPDAAIREGLEQPTIESPSQRAYPCIRPENASHAADLRIVFASFRPPCTRTQCAFAATDGIHGGAVTVRNDLESRLSPGMTPGTLPLNWNGSQGHVRDLTRSDSAPHMVSARRP